MEIVNLKNNAKQVLGINLNDNSQCEQLGKICADECVVFVNDAVSEQRLWELLNSWGTPSRAILHNYIADKKLSGRHWRELLVSLGYLTNSIEDQKVGMSRVSFEKNEKGKPTGIFTNGELDWHSDQQSTHESQRIIGLMSLWGSQGSQTTFLCTNPAYELLSEEDRTMADELYSVWEWDGSMCEDLIESQTEIVKYHMVPANGMECPLVDETATGKRGFKFPSHSFSHFRGMSKKDSLKFREHIWNKINRPEYIYTHNWKDGQIVFMDQNITLHARPTDVKDGDSRTMSRTISHVDKLFPESGKIKNYVLYKGEKLSHDEFAEIVDKQRHDFYYNLQK